MSEIKISEVNYGKFGKCVQLTNGDIEVVVTVDMGPRIIRYALVGGENVFCEAPDRVLDQKTGFRLLGGHRLWHAPEDLKRCYGPDNDPVKWQEIENGILVAGNPEPNTGMLKEMEISIEEEGTEVYVLHRITNNNWWPIEFAAWGLSMMAPGGKEIIPLNQEMTAPLANNFLAFWPYVKLNDHRIWYGSEYITLTQDPSHKPPFKLGVKNNQGWAAYFNKGQLFVKQFFPEEGQKYPDGGMTYETYTTDFMLEMETLSPMYTVDPGDCVEHEEIWMIIDGVECPENNDDSIDAILGEYMEYEDECCCDECGCDDCDCDDCDEEEEE